MSAEDVPQAEDRPKEDLPEEGVMSFGDHLEALRSCCIRALIGIAIGTGLALVFAKRILAFILQPALVVLDAHGQRAQIQALSPPDTFVTYLKMAFFAGLIVSMPYALVQIWRFVAAGLYERERRFVRLLAPVSVLLFSAGVVFMFYIVLPIVLNFFVSFGEQIEVLDLRPNAFQKIWLSPGDDGEDPDPDPLAADIPTRRVDPVDPPVGSIWVNTTKSTLCVQTVHGPFSVPMQRLDRASAVRSQFGLNYYISFVLSLSLAFGLAFELPLVVLFLVSTKIVSVPELEKSRRYVILGVFFASAVLTPPDVLSQLLLAFPMVILFEGSLVVSRVMVRRRTAREMAEAQRRGGD